MRPEGELVVSYGGGVNSVAVLVHLHRLRLVPRAIVMADPGSEWRATMRYLDEHTRPLCDRIGFPDPVVITRAEEGEHRNRAWRLESLAAECERVGMLPSVAYGWKKCSQKYKAETQRWWIARQEWALAEWEAGRKLIKVIGYDMDEGGRVKRGQSFSHAWEAARFRPWYPLYEAGLDREGCEVLIASEGLPTPGKSACTFCPNNTLADWERLRSEEPDQFAAAVAMSERAAPNITDPDVVGLMRCNPHGRRQLHVWAAGGYPPPPVDRQVTFDDWIASMPCECAA